jgi:hypothetical protein
MTTQTKIDIKANTRDFIGVAAAWQSWKILDVIFKNIWRTVFFIAALLVGINIFSACSERQKKDAEEWKQFYAVYNYCVKSQMKQYGDYNRISCLKYANAHVRKYDM